MHQLHTGKTSKWTLPDGKVCNNSTTTIFHPQEVFIPFPFSILAPHPQQLLPLEEFELQVGEDKQTCWEEKNRTGLIPSRKRGLSTLHLIFMQKERDYVDLLHTFAVMSTMALKKSASNPFSVFVFCSNLFLKSHHSLNSHLISSASLSHSFLLLTLFSFCNVSFEHLEDYFPREMFYKHFYKTNLGLSVFALFPWLLRLRQLSWKGADLRDIKVLAGSFHTCSGHLWSVQISICQVNLHSMIWKEALFHI